MHACCNTSRKNNTHFFSHRGTREGGGSLEVFQNCHNQMHCEVRKKNKFFYFLHTIAIKFTDVDHSTSPLPSQSPFVTIVVNPQLSFVIRRHHHPLFAIRPPSIAIYRSSTLSFAACHHHRPLSVIHHCSVNITVRHNSIQHPSTSVRRPSTSIRPTLSIH